MAAIDSIQRLLATRRRAPMRAAENEPRDWVHGGSGGEEFGAEGEKDAARDGGKMTEERGS